MYYYHFRFNPQEASEPKQITDLINHIQEDCKFLTFRSNNKILACSSTKDIGKKIFEFVKENFTQDFEVEMQLENPRESKVIYYHNVNGAIVTHFMIPFYDASYICDIYDKKE